MRLKRAGKTALGILIAALVWIAMVPCMFTPLGVLFPLPFIYLSHRRNMWWGVGAYALATAAYMLLLGTLAAVWAGLGILPFLVALRLIREKRPMMGSVLILAGTSLVSMLLGVLVLSLATGQSLIPYLEGVIRAYLSGDSLPAVLRDPLLRMIDLASNGTALLTAEQSLELYRPIEAGDLPRLMEGAVEAASLLLYRSLPYFLMFWALVCGVACWTAPVFLLRRAGLDVAVLPQFSRWALPKRIGFGLFVLVVVSLLGYWVGIPGFMVVYYTLSQLFLLAYGLQGLAVISFLLRRWRVPLAGRVPVEIICWLLFACLLPVLGVAEQFFQIRQQLTMRDL